MFIQTNPNPLKKNTGDCAVRAIAIVSDQTWEQAYLDLCMQGLILADMPNANSVWSAYLMAHGFRRRIIPNVCPDCYTIGEFADDHPKGDFVVCTGSHVVTVLDGDVLDAWNSMNEVPAYYFQRGD